MTPFALRYQTIQLALLFLSFPLAAAHADGGPTSSRGGATAGAKELGLEEDLPRGNISGIVTDHEGTPIPDASLQVEPEMLGALRYDQLHFQSDEEGRFGFAGVPSGRYTFRLNGLGEGYYGIYQEKAVNVPPDSTAEVVFTIPVGRIHGKVLRAGKPAPGYGVDVSSIDPIEEFRGQVISQEPDGRYRMDCAPVGDIFIALVDPDSKYYPRILRSRTLHIGQGEEIEVNWDAPTASVSGTVLYKASESHGTDAEIFLVSYDLRQLPRRTNWIYGGVHTSPEGKFEIPGLPPGRYRLEVLAPTMVYCQDVVLSEGETVGNLNLEVLESGAISLRLTLPESMEDPYASLHLSLETGEGANGVPVLMPKKLNPDSIEERPIWWSSKKKELDIPGLAPGAYSLTLYSPEFGSLVQEGIGVHPGEATQVKIEPKQPVQFAISVVDPENQPISEPTICLTTASGASVGSTQLRCFVWLYPVFVYELQPGQYRVRIGKEGFRAADVELDLTGTERMVQRTVTLVRE